MNSLYMPHGGVAELRARLSTALEDDLSITEPETRHALAALTEDDGVVDFYEAKSAARLLGGPTFSTRGTEDAKTLAKFFVAGIVPAVSDRWTQDAQQDFEGRYFLHGRGVAMPPEAQVTDLATVPAQVRDAALRYGTPDPRRSEKASVFLLPVNGCELYAVHTQQAEFDQLVLYDRLGGLVTWGAGSKEYGFFWED